MEFLFGLIVLLTIAVVGLIIYLINVVKTDDYNRTIVILQFFVKWGLLVMISAQALLTVVSLFYIADSAMIILLCVKQIIITTFYVLIYIEVKDLLNNLVESKIFIDTNAKLTKQAGLLFLYLALTEMITGLLLGLLFMDATGNFNITTNNTIIIYIIIGLVLQIVSKILDKATTIYNEHQLTI